MKEQISSILGHNPIRTYEVKRYEPTNCIEKYSYMLIRPPRFLYNQQILNPRRRYKGKYEYQSFSIPFPLSLYIPSAMRYVILYLHGNSSSRYEGYTYISSLPSDVGLACFDFGGCGNRTQKEFISLGKSQAQEVNIAVRFLKSKGYQVVLWGRSMGSVSVLLSSECDVIVADSPFSSLKTVCKQLAEAQVPCGCMCCFHCFFPCFFWMVARDVETKTDMNPSELQIGDIIAKSPSNKSIIFLAAKGDKMINHNHAKILYDKFQGKNKKLILFEGGHNTERPIEVLHETFQFIERSLNPDSHRIMAKKPAASARIQRKSQEDDVADIGSFSILKEDKAERLSLQMKTSIKMQISSKIVQGGQSEKVEFMNQSQGNESQAPN